MSETEARVELIEALEARAVSDSPTHSLMREAAAMLRRPEPQGEPSDSQVLAAVQAYKGQNVDPFKRRIIGATNWEMECMRAALRAAGSVR